MKATLPCLLAVLVGATPVAAPAQAPPAGVPVRVGLVRKESVGERRQVIGSIEPARRSAVAAEQAGRITHAPPEPGLAVKQGQVLATIDDAILKAQHDEAAAALASAEAYDEEQAAYLEIAERNLERIASLRDSGAVEEKELEDGRSRAVAARALKARAAADRQRARAAVALIETRLARTRIVAPFDGFTVAKSTELGQWVEPGDAVSQVVDLARVKVRLGVPQELIGFLNAEEPVALWIDALGCEVSAPLFSVIPDADARARMFEVLVKVDNADARLKPGMSVRGMLRTGVVEEALTVPRDAVQTTPGGTIVYAFRGGLAVGVPVGVRFGHGDRFVVTGDLRDGERVIVEGNERLRPGQPVTIAGERAEQVETP